MTSTLRAAALTALALLTGTQVSLSADLPSARYAPVAPIAPAYNWYGFFIGAQAGYGWGSGDVNYFGGTGAYAVDVGTVIPLSLSSEPRGFIGGVQWGSNYQFGNWVLGFISDYGYADVTRKTNVTLTGPGTVFGARTTFADVSLETFGTTRGRIGYAWDNVMLYASGGLANGRADVTLSNPAVGTACGVASACPFGHRSKGLWGWALGGGLEYGMGPWSVNVEYLHYDLGDRALVYGDLIAPGALGARGEFSGDIVRAGINYRFNWTPLGVLMGTDRLQ